MYLVDTDHLGIIQRHTEPEFGRLVSRMQQHSLDDFFVSVVSFHEEVLGWSAYLNRARTSVAVVHSYRQFESILADFSTMNVVSYDDAAATIFDSLRKQGIRVATLDLRIAATAISRGMTVLTRNLKDFAKVPGLNVEDWTAA